MPAPPADTAGARAATRLNDLAAGLLAQPPLGILVADREGAMQEGHVLADFDRNVGDLEAAYAHLRRLAELDPLDTHVQRELLEVCLRRGRRTEAARRYHALRMRTMRELGQEPGFALSDLGRRGRRHAR